MAGMRMTALAAGLGAALAAGPDDANAQATEMVVPLETGGEVVFDMRNFGFETQAGIIDRLTACIEAGEKPRDVCVGNVALELQTERLGTVVRETRAVLRPLEDEIGLTPAELIEEPDFCYAAQPGNVEACAGAVETARLAGLDFRIAEARSLRLAREAEAAGLAAEAEAGRERLAELAAEAEAGRGRVAELAAEAEAGRGRVAELAAEAEAGRERVAELAAQAEANRAVLSVLQQIAAEEAGQARPRPSGS